MTTAIETETVKVLAHRLGLAEAVRAGFALAPARSPKPILQSVLLDATEEDGSEIHATDLEVGVRVRALGVKVDRPGKVVLPPRVLKILETSQDEEMAVEVEDAQIVVRGLRAEFRLPAEDPGLFPEVPEPTGPHAIVAAGDLRDAIDRTIFATDAQSTRFALGGVRIEPKLGPDGSPDPNVLNFIGTDGRRLAIMPVASEMEGAADPVPGRVIPAKALKLLRKLVAKSDPAEPIHYHAAQDNAAWFVVPGHATAHTRYVEGRFPRWQDVVPRDPGTRIPLDLADFVGAIRQAAIATSDDSRAVDFAFGAGRMLATSQAADVGASRVEIPIGYDGDEREITFDPRYVTEMLAALRPDDPLEIAIIDHKHAAVFRSGEYAYVVMPLTRDR